MGKDKGKQFGTCAKCGYMQPLGYDDKGLMLTKWVCSKCGLANTIYDTSNKGYVKVTGVVFDKNV